MRQDTKLKEKKRGTGCGRRSIRDQRRHSDLLSQQWRVKGLLCFQSKPHWDVFLRTQHPFLNSDNQLGQGTQSLQQAATLSAFMFPSRLHSKYPARNEPIELSPSHQRHSRSELLKALGDLRPIGLPHNNPNFLYQWVLCLFGKCLWRAYWALGITLSTWQILAPGFLYKKGTVTICIIQMRRHTTTVVGLRLKLHGVSSISALAVWETVTAGANGLAKKDKAEGEMWSPPAHLCHGARVSQTFTNF